MAITSLDTLIAGLLPAYSFYKTGTGMKVAGQFYSFFYTSGFPGPAVASAAGINGEALTSYPGQLLFPGAVAGKEIRLARVEAMQTSSIGGLSVMDRLWHNSGFVVTSLAAQALTTPTWPARDRNGSSNGVRVLGAMEVTSTLGAGTPPITVTYTNSDGVAGRTGTIGPILTTNPVGMFLPMTMQSGDRGVRSIQSIQSSATMTSGSVSFVAYRELVAIPTASASNTIDRDAVSIGLPVAFDGTVPFLVGLATGTAGTNVDGSMVWTQG